MQQALYSVYTIDGISLFWQGRKCHPILNIILYSRVVLYMYVYMPESLGGFKDAMLGGCLSKIF